MKPGVFTGGYGNSLGPESPSSYADANLELLSVHQVLLAEELRLASTDPHARLIWLAGLFYSHLRQEFTQYNYLTVEPGLPAIATDDHIAQAELSAFGQVDLAIDERWKLGAGLRVGWERTTGVSQSGGYANQGAVPFSSGASSNTLPAMPRYTASYQPETDHFYYASVAKGFRGGGSNGVPPTQCGSGSSIIPAFFGPDSVWSYELGAKGRFFERRLQLDASVYYVRWNGVQVHVYDACGNGFISNDGAIRSKGSDLSADASLSNRLRLTLILASTARFTKTVSLVNGQVIAGVQPGS